jgi:hypothetical protein
LDHALELGPNPCYQKTKGTAIEPVPFHLPLD